VADAEGEISRHADGHVRPSVSPPRPAAVEPAAGFDGFFLQHHDPLVRALSLTLGDDELGRDAAAEGFARALQRWNRVSRYDNPAGWIYRVGLNWARSRRRKSRRELLVEQAAPDRLVAGAADPDPAVAIALSALSVDHRAVIVGRYYLDWSERQLADALDVAPGTVKSRLSRALERLQELLPDTDAPSGRSTSPTARPDDTEDDPR
jgi:RNA polymerase sigma-70 factor (ECF subfamily)